MGKGIILLTRIRKEAEQLSEFLVNQSYRVILSEHLGDQGQKPDWKKNTIALIDLDSVEVENYTIRRLATKYPQLHLLCMSHKRLHPDLKEAISNYFYACLAKPLDFDELRYWLKCVEDNAAAGDRR